MIAWKTQGGHRRISIQSIHDHQIRANLSPKVQTPQGKYLKVMVVEDDSNSRAMYQAHFDSWDLPIDAVIQVSAIEALLDIPVVKPQVLLADLRMPDINCVEMLRQLSAHPQFTKMSVIVITGLSNEEIAAYGELPSGTHVLPKPVDMGWLKGYFQAMLSLRTPSKRSAMPIETE